MSTQTEESTEPAIAATVRTGEEYRAGLRDGRRVWIDGEKVDDVTTHPVTAGMVETHARWYDLHRDPTWEKTFWRQDASGRRVPVTFTLPTTSSELGALAEALRATAFENAGNISHPACWGMLLCGGLWNMMASIPMGEAGRVKAFLDQLCAESKFLAGAYTPPQVARFRAEDDRGVVKVIKERQDGIIVRGGFAIATGAVYADWITSAPVPMPGTRPDEALFFAFRPSDTGVRIFLRKPATYSADRFSYPLSTRFDEQDVSLFLDDVFIPWEQVFVYRDPSLVAELPRHYNYQILAQENRILARAEFSAGLGLAVAASLGTAKIPAVEAALTDLYIHAQTVRTSIAAAVRECTITPAGIADPDLAHMSVGYMYTYENRAKLADTLRTLGGQSVITAPGAADLRDGADRSYLARLFGGGPLGAEQRTLLWNALRDHTVSTLEGREEIYTSLSTAGPFTWRKRVMGLAADSERMVEDALRIIQESGGVALPIRTRLGATTEDWFVR